MDCRAAYVDMDENGLNYFEASSQQAERLKSRKSLGNVPLLIVTEEKEIMLGKTAEESAQEICRMDLEGIVAKRRDGIYSASAKWVKIKNPYYTQGKGRHELFEGRRSKPSFLQS